MPSSLLMKSPAPLTIYDEHEIWAPLTDYCWINAYEGHMSNLKIRQALARHQTVVVGLDEGDQRLQPLDFAEEIIRQLTGSLAKIPGATVGQMIFIYQPRWAQDCWLPADGQRICIAHRQIRDLLAELYNDEVARRIRLIYGCPVLATAQAMVIKNINVDGLLKTPLKRTELSEVKK